MSFFKMLEFTRGGNLEYLIPSGWRNTSNVALSVGSVTKNAGGNSHNTGGGFYNLINAQGAFRLEFQVLQNNAFLFIGVTSSNQTAIAFNQLNYGVYLRGASPQMQIYRNGATVASEVISDLTLNQFALVRNQMGNIYLEKDGNIIYWYRQDDTDAQSPLVVDNSSLAVMVSIYTQGAGFTNLKLKK